MKQSFFFKRPALIAYLLVAAIQFFTCAHAATITGGPVISGFSPGTGKAGDFIFVMGNNFIPRQTQISVGGISAPAVQVLDPGLLLFMLPEGVTGGTVSATSPYGIAASSANFGQTLECLDVSGFWPAQGIAGRFVVVFGSQFSTVPGETQVAIGSVNASLIHVMAEDMLIFLVPPIAITNPLIISTVTTAFTTARSFLIPSGSPAPGSYIEGEILVGFENYVSLDQADAVVKSYGLNWTPNFPIIFSYWAKVISGTASDYILDLESSNLVNWAAQRGYTGGLPGVEYILISFNGSATPQIALELINSFAGLEPVELITIPRTGKIYVPSGEELLWIMAFDNLGFTGYAQLNYVIINY